MQYINQKRLVTEIFYAALKAVDPYESVKLYTDRVLSLYKISSCKKIIVIGFGKASCQMTNAIVDFASDSIEKGIVITKYGHNIYRESEVTNQKSKIKIYEAGHPVPDENGLKGTEEIIKLLKDSDEDTLVVCLISGGGSSLLVSPYEGITLNEKKKTTELLLKAGANINEINTVRKHISRVKGGRLVEIVYPVKVISLILSDVIGDRIDVIASGPTSPDKTTYEDALNVLRKYGLMEKSPQAVLEVFYKGAEGLIPETPKEGNKIFERVENIIIGNNKKLLNAAKTSAESLGLRAEILSEEIRGEAKDVGRWLAEKALETHKELLAKRDRQICLISGGETTVTVKGSGTGGRNMELALAFAMEIEGNHGITLLSADTDGTDGPTDAAGAIVNGETITKAKALGLDPKEYLENNDSDTLFKKIDSLFITGPTGTNVMDIQTLVVE